MAKARTTLGVLARTSPEPDERVLLLSCMDLQLEEAGDATVKDPLPRRYDHMALAGASLGAVTTRFPHWGRTFYEHLALARAIHGVRRVVLLDHRDCEAYERLLALGLADDRSREREVHLAHQQKLRRKIHALDPSIQVDCWLLSVDGRVEDMSGEEDLWLPGITERRRKSRSARKSRPARKAKARGARPRR
jgi:hypothetical protein